MQPELIAIQPNQPASSSLGAQRSPSIHIEHDEDLDGFLARLTSDKSRNHFGFVYMQSRLSRSHQHHDPYDLVVLEYGRVDKSDYYTVSKEVYLRLRLTGLYYSALSHLHECRGSRTTSAASGSSRRCSSGSASGKSTRK